MAAVSSFPTKKVVLNTAQNGVFFHTSWGFPR